MAFPPLSKQGAVSAFTIRVGVSLTSYDYLDEQTAVDI